MSKTDKLTAGIRLLSVFILGAIATALGLLIFFRPDLPKSAALTIGLVSFSIGFLSIISNYSMGREAILKTGEVLFQPFSSVIRSLIGIDIGYSRLELDTYSLERIIKQQEEISSRIKNDQRAMSSNAEEKVVSLFREALSKELDFGVQTGLAKLVSDRVALERQTESMEILQSSISHMKSASSTVTVRGFLNLVIGILFASAALALLKSSIDLFTPERLLQLNASQAIYLIGLRISLALIITLIAYFFLTLYRKSLEDVKYYQNEITDISSRLSAISIAQSVNNSALISEILSSLMAVDRNSATKMENFQSEPLHQKVALALIEKIPK